MADRIVTWLSAGILAAGLSAAAIGGAGMAGADEEGGGNAAASAQSTVSPDNDPESAAENPDGTTDPVDEATDEIDEIDEIDETDEPVEGPADEQAVDDPEEVADEIETSDDATRTDRDNDGADEAQSAADTSAPPAVTDRQRDPVLAVTDEPREAEGAGSPHASEASAAPVVNTSTAASDASGDVQPSPASARLVTAVDDEQRAPRPSLLNVVGTFFWSLFDLAVKLIDFPPAVPREAR